MLFMLCHLSFVWGLHVFQSVAIFFSYTCSSPDHCPILSSNVLYLFSFHSASQHSQYTSMYNMPEQAYRNFNNATVAIRLVQYLTRCMDID